MELTDFFQLKGVRTTKNLSQLRETKWFVAHGMKLAKSHDHVAKRSKQEVGYE